MTNSTSPPQSDAAVHYLKEKALASRLAVSRRTLQRWRAFGEGPTFVEFGRSIRYPLEAVLAYEAAARHGGGGGALNPLSPFHMTPAERRAEMCRIMALGLVRLLQRKSTHLSEKTGESSLDFPPDQSGHATCQSRRVA